MLYVIHHNEYLLGMKMIKMVYITLVVLGFVLYIISLYTPILSVQEFYIFEEEITILSTLSILHSGNEWLLYIVILIFTIILPLAKYTLLFTYTLNQTQLMKNKKMIIFLEYISKWAMLDVFIVALFIVSIKLKMLASAETEVGLYLFVGSIIISIICTQIQNNILKRELNNF